MRIVDDGKKLTITTRPGALGTMVAGIFCFLAAVFPIIALLALVLPPNQVTIDCERSRGTCEVTGKPRVSSVPIASIAKAEVLYASGAKNRSAGHYLVLRLASGGAPVELTDTLFHDDRADAIRRAAVGLNTFLGDAKAPSFNASFIANDNDWVVVIMFSIFLALMAWAFTHLLAVRTTEIDREGGTVKVGSKRWFARAETSETTLDNIARIWVLSGRVELVQIDGPPLAVVTAPRGYNPALIGGMVRTLAEATKKPIDAKDADRRYLVFSP